LSAYGSM